MEPAPPSLSIFDDLPLRPQLSGGGDDALVLPNISRISRILMEEDTADEFLDQYPDHPALLQTQQLFGQILFDASSDALALRPACNSVEISTISIVPAPYDSSAGAQGDVQDPAAFALNALEVNSFLPAESSSCCKDLVSMAFFKGMEEADKFLPPIDSGETMGGRGRKKRLDDRGDGEEAGVNRRSKQMAVAADGEESEEAAAAREALDQLMLSGGEPTSLADMQELRVALGMGTTPPVGRRGGSASAMLAAVDLHAMLIRCAEAVSTDDRYTAADLLERIRRHSSPAGDGTQRLAHYFAEALEARLAGTGSLRYRRALSATTKRGSAADILKSYQFFVASCCFLPVSFLVANRAIYDAAAGKKRLHIVDYGINHGFQWPELLGRLASRDGGPPEVRLTAIDNPQPGLRPSQLIEEAGCRLSACARRLGVPFTFRGIAARPEAVRAEDLVADGPDEVLAVNCLFHFRTLMDESTAGGGDGEQASPVDAVLGAIGEAGPRVFVHAIVNTSYSTAFFATRFREALHNFTALFDIMDTVAPRGNERRWAFERDILAPSAMSLVACEGADREVRPQSYKQWQAWSQRAGLRQLPLDADVVGMVRDKVRKEHHRFFVVDEDHRWLVQGWKGRMLYAISTWTADDGFA